jgi:hypothetical protein
LNILAENRKTQAGAAVLRLAPEKFWQFSAALFQNQAEFFDVSVVNELHVIGQLVSCVQFVRAIGGFGDHQQSENLMHVYPPGQPIL